MNIFYNHSHSWNRDEEDYVSAYYHLRMVRGIDTYPRDYEYFLGEEETGFCRTFKHVIGRGVSFLSFFSNNNYNVHICDISEIPNNELNTVWLIDYDDSGTKSISREVFDWLRRNYITKNVIDKHDRVSYALRNYEIRMLPPDRIDVKAIEQNDVTLAYISGTTCVYTKASTDVYKAQSPLITSFTAKEVDKYLVGKGTRSISNRDYQYIYYLELLAPQEFIFRSNRRNSFILTFKELNDMSQAKKIIDNNYNNLRYKENQ